MKEGQPKWKSNFQIDRSKGRGVGRWGGGNLPKTDGLKPKDLIGIPWHVAFALQADGWYLRSDIIWSKPNPMPESVTDRPTKAHEYLFLLSKSERYYYDSEAIKEPASPETAAHLLRGVSANHKNVNGAPGQTPHSMNQPRENKRSARDSFKRDGSKRESPIIGQNKGTHRPDRDESEYDTGSRNCRTVWTIATRPYKGAHFATFPPALIEPCILAGSRIGDLVLDPFSGTATVGKVAIQYQRNYIGVELNPAYLPLARARVEGTQISMVLSGQAVNCILNVRRTQQMECLWATDDLIRTFVAGAQWWEYHRTWATMWPSARDRAEAEAERRFLGGRPSHDGFHRDGCAGGHVTNNIDNSAAADEP